MSDKEKPLPKPPGTPFGRKRNFEEGGKSEALMADQMAMAMSKGKLEEFIQKEMPDNEHARKLAEMMMGMTGMLPTGGFSGMSAPKKDAASPKTAPKKSGKSSDVKPPEDVINAVKDADVSGLVELLKREQKKRSPGTETDATDKKSSGPAAAPNQTAIEKEVLKQLIKIASDNNLSLDWIFFRALKRFVEEYKKTGNL